MDFAFIKEPKRSWLQPVRRPPNVFQGVLPAICIPSSLPARLECAEFGQACDNTDSCAKASQTFSEFITGLQLSATFQRLELCNPVLGLMPLFPNVRLLLFICCYQTREVSVCFAFVLPTRIFSVSHTPSQAGVFSSMISCLSLLWRGISDCTPHRPKWFLPCLRDKGFCLSTDCVLAFLIKANG